MAIAISISMAEICGCECAKVVIGGRNEKSAKEALRNIWTIGSEGIFVHTVLLKVDDCRNPFDKAYKTYGKIEGFFNYAGVYSS